MAAGELAGRVALITGSSSGIGEATARRLSSLGAAVVINSSSSVGAGEALATELGPDAHYVQADIAKPESGQYLVDATVDRFGQLDYLINNAGWTTVVPHANLDDLTDDIFTKTFEINVYGTWRLTKAAITHLRASDDPTVVTVTSVAGVRPIGSSIAYSMAKAALNQMTLLLAKSYGPIRFNAVAPGLVETPWTKSWDTQHAAVARTAPLARSATPDDCAEAVLALLRMSYASGEILVLDGGMTTTI